MTDEISAPKHVIVLELKFAHIPTQANIIQREMNSHCRRKYIQFFFLCEANYPCYYYLCEVSQIILLYMFQK